MKFFLITALSLYNVCAEQDEQVTNKPSANN